MVETITARLVAFIGDENACCAPAQREHSMPKRNRSKPPGSIQARLIAFAKEMREKAALLPPGAEQDDLLRRARQAETTSHLDEWVNSPGLKPPN
jgi:hypothetical protein